MAVDFTVFDWPHRIEHLQQTKGYRDQDTSEWVAGSEAAADITGNFDVGPIEGETHDLTGTVSAGQAALYTTAPLALNDRVRVHFDDSGTNFAVYVVDNKDHDFAWLEQFSGPDGRAKYALVLEGKDG